MLAHNYMTAEDLKISQELHSALIKVLGMFERGEMQHVKYKDGFLPDLGKDQFGFNMAVGKFYTDCGTVGCFAGWASEIMKCDVTEIFADVATMGLACLFYGHSVRTFIIGGPFRLSEVTTEQATLALRNYLTTGKPDWEIVLQ